MNSMRNGSACPLGKTWLCYRSAEYPLNVTDYVMFVFIFCAERYVVNVGDSLETRNMMATEGGGCHRNDDPTNNEDTTNCEDITNYDDRDCDDR